MISTEAQETGRSDPLGDRLRQLAEAAGSERLDNAVREGLEKSAMKQKLPGYTEADISDEAWREVVYPDRVYRIDNPVKLIFRAGGSTHRVVDAAGVVHCYAAPESGKTTLRWKAKEGLAPVRF